MAVVARRVARGVSYWVCTSWRGTKHWERSGSDRREAQRLDARRKREVKAGTFTPPAAGGGTLVRTYLASWLDRRAIRTIDTERALLRDYVLPREWFASMLAADELLGRRR